MGTWAKAAEFLQDFYIIIFGDKKHLKKVIQEKLNFF
jgi:hypothetical protein